MRRNLGALALLWLLLAVGLTAHAGQRRWGVDEPSPYYVPRGLQSPLRDDGLHLGGDLWIDTGYQTSRRALDSEPDLHFWLMKGRFMLDLTATYTWRERFFIQAKGQLLAHVEEIRNNEFIDTDDAWVRFGMWDLWDIQIGRFEGWRVYHKGEGFERDTLEHLGAPNGARMYEVDHAFYRQDGFGQAAVHVYPLSWLRFELGSVFGNELGFNSVGVRPVGIVDFGWVRFKLAGEYRRLQHQEDGRKEWESRRGLGGGLAFYFDEPHRVVRVQVGVNAAYGWVDRVTPFGEVDERGSPDTLSLGGFFNLGLWSAVVGFGYNHTIQGDRQRNEQTGREGEFTHKQLFASVRHHIFLPELMAKLVFSWAEADIRPAFDNGRVNEMYSVRLRLAMVF
jgi:hypothetical protein